MPRYILNQGFTDLLYPVLERVIIDHKPDEYLSREEGLKELLVAYNSYFCELNGLMDDLRRKYLKAEAELYQLCADNQADKSQGMLRETAGWVADFVNTEGTPEERKRAFKSMMIKMKEGLHRSFQ